MSLLERIVESKRREIQNRKEKRSIEKLRSITPMPQRDFVTALKQPELSIIAEAKRKSPSAGLLRDPYYPDRIAQSYEANGAAAMSVLTDEPFFGGRLTDLQLAKQNCSMPILRKDFLLDPFQLEEAAVCGADAVLFIVRLLDPILLKTLIQKAEDLNLSALVEIHAESELPIAMDAGASIIGINNRNLDTLEIDLDLSLRLVDEIPDEIIKVSESGIRTASDAGQMRNAGFDAILIGEALMKMNDTGKSLREMGAR